MGMFLNFGLRWQYQGRSGEIKRGSENLFKQAFLNLNHDLVDWTPAFGAIVEDVLTPFVEEQFESEGAKGGITWADLAPETLKRRQYPGRSILYQTGALAHSFVSKGGSHVENITPKKLQWGSILPHALFHQTGTGKGFQRDNVATGPGSGRGMPRRRIFWDPKSAAGKELTHQMGQKMSGYISQVARRYGFGIAKGRGISPGDAARIGRIALGLK